MLRISEQLCLHKLCVWRQPQPSRRYCLSLHNLHVSWTTLFLISLCLRLYNFCIRGDWQSPCTCCISLDKFHVSKRQVFQICEIKGLCLNDLDIADTRQFSRGDSWDHVCLDNLCNTASTMLRFSNCKHLCILHFSTRVWRPTIMYRICLDICLDDSCLQSLSGRRAFMSLHNLLPRLKSVCLHGFGFPGPIVLCQCRKTCINP